MEFEVKITGSTPEELTKIAHALVGLAGGKVTVTETAAGEAEPKAPRKKRTPDAEAAPPAKDPLEEDGDSDDDLLGGGGAISYTIPQVQNAIKELLDKDKPKYSVQLKKIMNDLGVANATALDPGQCVEFMNRLKALK